LPSDPTRTTGRQTGAAAVHATFRLSDSQPAEIGEVPPATLLGYACTLIAMAEGMDAGKVSMIETSAHFFAPQICDTVEGEAVLIEARGPLWVWQCDLRAAGGDLARITCRYMARSPDRAAPDAIDTPAPDTRAQAQAARAARHLADRREAIAAAACHVIADKGFAAASMREIAEVAAMHVPTMYQYVRSKEEVLELVYHWVFERIRRNVTPALDADLPAREKLLGVVASLVANNGAMPREAGVLNRELRSLSRAARRRVLDDYAGIVDGIARIIADGVAEGQFRPVDPHLTANFIDALCDIWALRQFAIGQFSEAKFKSEIEAFFLHGISNPAPMR
jgi:AcrR family transcriptional regulator